LPVESTVAGILGVQDALPITQTGDPGAADLLSQDISVGQAPLAARFFDDLSKPARDRAEEPVPCFNDLVRGVLSTLGGRIACRRRIRLRQGRFGAPRDEDQNEEGGPQTADEPNQIEFVGDLIRYIESSTNGEKLKQTG
jgi:hypothetical protein